jgi:hypothetical protein
LTPRFPDHVSFFCSFNIGSLIPQPCPSFCSINIGTSIRRPSFCCNINIGAPIPRPCLFFLQHQYWHLSSPIIFLFSETSVLLPKFYDHVSFSAASIMPPQFADHLVCMISIGTVQLADHVSFFCSINIATSIRRPSFLLQHQYWLHDSPTVSLFLQHHYRHLTLSTIFFCSINIGASATYHFPFSDTSLLAPQFADHLFLQHQYWCPNSPSMSLFSAA